MCKFIRGKLYRLKIKGGPSTKPMITTYKCIQIINTIRDEKVDVVIMKEVKNNIYNNLYKRKIYCLNQIDCRRYHIKYQPGLEVMSKKLNWQRVYE